MDLHTVTALYFVGAGGIGMSALIRYFLANGKRVGGYDKTPSELTAALIREGAAIHYTDDMALVEDCFLSPEHTLVVYTPAIPDSHTELTYFRTHGFQVVKRAQLLGEITLCNRGLCVAGTHGKTTTSSMLAHILKQSHVDCNAFLGGILKGYESNLMLSKKSDLTVIEADEFDRSFHWLRPYMAVITSADPDHLDIYGTAEAYRESFEHFTSLVSPDGVLLMKKGVLVAPRLQENVRLFTYSATEKADFYAENVVVSDGSITFDFVGPNVRIDNVELGVPVMVNIENGTAAMAIAWLNGATEEEIRRGMATFKGPHRRFEFHLKTPQCVLIDDYAHHPAELKQSILSVKALYPNRRLTGVFQPHLYTRTRDFASDFAASLSLLDELILLDIYPAREEPIPGVTSALIFDQVTLPADRKKLIQREELLALVEQESFEVVLMVGAGNIDRLVEPVKEILVQKIK